MGKKLSEVMYTDIISIPFFLVSEKVQKTIKMYEPRMVMKELVLLDQGIDKAERYFLPISAVQIGIIETAG